VGALVEHGFDREGHAGLQAYAFAALAEVGDVGVHVHVAADAVTAEVSYDCVACACRELADRCTDVAEACIRSDLFDARPECALRGFDESCSVVADLADHERRGSVTVKATVERGDVDVDDVAVLQDVSR
jgi:hypothetical protein